MKSCHPCNGFFFSAKGQIILFDLTSLSLSNTHVDLFFGLMIAFFAMNSKMCIIMLQVGIFWELNNVAT